MNMQGPAGGDYGQQWEAEVAKTQEHLRTLSICHYVAGGLVGLSSCFSLLHIGMGVLFIVSPEAMDGAEHPPELFGWAFLIGGLAWLVLGWTVAILLLVAGGCLRKRKRRMFCLIAAGIGCIVVPLGTVLGVFTIVVLTKEVTKRIFESASAQYRAGRAG